MINQPFFLGVLDFFTFFTAFGTAPVAGEISSVTLNVASSSDGAAAGDLSNSEIVKCESRIVSVNDGVNRY